MIVSASPTALSRRSSLGIRRHRATCDKRYVPKRRGVLHWKNERDQYTRARRCERRASTTSLMTRTLQNSSHDATRERHATSQNYDARARIKRRALLANALGAAQARPGGRRPWATTSYAHHFRAVSSAQQRRSSGQVERPASTSIRCRLASS